MGSVERKISRGLAAIARRAEVWTFATLCVAWAGCKGDSGGDADPEQTLNAGVKLPNEGMELDDPPVDESVMVMGMSSGGGGPGPVYPGDIIRVSLAFAAPMGNVVGAGIRFGEEGPVRTVDIPDARGLMEGVLEFDVEIPASVCDDIAQICHDVKCYEFAVTDIGEVSVANINDIGLVCAGCEVPQCQDLLDCGSADTGMATSAGDGADGADGADGGPQCQQNSECGTNPGGYGTYVCKAGVCGECESDADCDSDRQCFSGSCYAEYCEMYPTVPVELYGVMCACPDASTLCADAPECPGLCVGGVCRQDCGLSTGEGFCQSICAEGWSCSSSASFGEDYCSL